MRHPAVPALLPCHNGPPMATAAALRNALQEAIGRAVVGQQQVIDGLFLAVLVGGHVLLEGVPGTAKTLMARCLAATLDARFSRVQFTPDLLPSDIIGTNVYRADSASFEFRPGPIFTDTLLADEINRAPAKTQAALLEAMEERQVTSDGRRMPLGGRFLVVATQNPIEYEGTYPLPEAQLDRFLLKLEVTVPPGDAEAEMLRRFDRGFDPHDLERAGVTVVIDQAALEAARREVAAVTVSEAIVAYIGQLIGATRMSPDLALGASPRGAIALLLGGKAMAALRGRAYVTPEDVKDICVPALRHRLIRRPEAEIQGVTEVGAVERAVSRVPVPR
jgi:MoxR-like ATPase